MFKIISVSDVVRIPPSLFGLPLKDAARNVLRRRYEGQVIKDMGLIVSVLNVDVSDLGTIIPGDGALYHEVTLNALVFEPLLHEVLEGEAVTVEDFGLLVRIGPVDGFIHKSQIQDDFFSYDRRQGSMLGRETRRIVRKGDALRARVVSVSYGGEFRMLRVGMTMRQPYLGKLNWIEQDLKELLQKMGET